MGNISNLGRVQGGGFFGSTSTSTSSIEKTTVQVNGVSPLLKDTIVNANGDLCRIEEITSTHYTVTKYGSIKGDQGLQGNDGEDGTNGADGQDGKSAYQIWLDNGHTGTEDDFLDSLKGQDGAQGEKGADGQDGITPHIGDNGNWYIGETDTGTKAQGDKGDTVPASTATPLMDGTGEVGTSESYARGDHRHPSDTTKANTTGTYPNMTVGNATNADNATQARTSTYASHAETSGYAKDSEHATDADKLAGKRVEELVAYDLIIRTQEEFEAFYKSLDKTFVTDADEAEKCHAHSVLFVGDGGTLTFTRSDGWGLHLPDTLYRIDGINNARILVENWVYEARSNEAVMWYSSTPTDKAYSISSLTIHGKAADKADNSIMGIYSCTELRDCSIILEGAGAAKAFGFVQCEHLIDCGVELLGDYLTGFDTCLHLTDCKVTISKGNDGRGFDGCSQLVNCEVSIHYGLYAEGFVSCTNMVNCTADVVLPDSAATLTAFSAYAFRQCNQLTNCTGTATTPSNTGGNNAYGFASCIQLTNCTASASSVGSFAYSNCSYCSNCKVVSGTWSGPNTKRDDDSCDV